MAAPVTVAIVGGRRKVGVDPPGVVVRRFGSAQDRGDGAIGRATAAICAGGVDAVIVLTRWISHPSFWRVRDACRKAAVPLRVCDGGESSANRELVRLAAAG